jgi:hypothetical protein
MPPTICKPCSALLQQAVIADPPGIHSYTMSQRWRLRSNTGHLLSKDCELCALLRAAVYGDMHRYMLPEQAMEQGDWWKSMVLDHTIRGKKYSPLTVRFLEGCNLIGDRKERSRRAGIAGLQVEVKKSLTSKTQYYRGRLSVYANAGKCIA